MENDIRDIEHEIKRLQTENAGLICELGAVRMENNSLRGNKSPPLPSRATRCATGGYDARCLERDSASMSQSDDPFGSLCQPFAAIWNLIRSYPTLIRETESPGTVLDRLRGMAEFGLPARAAMQGHWSSPFIDALELRSLTRKE